MLFESPRDVKSTQALSALARLNSKVNKCPLGEITRAIDVLKLPEPVPDSTTR
jgi:hypothetical protein